VLQCFVAATVADDTRHDMAQSLVLICGLIEN